MRTRDACLALICWTWALTGCSKPVPADASALTTLTDHGLHRFDLSVCGPDGQARAAEVEAIGRDASGVLQALDLRVGDETVRVERGDTHFEADAAVVCWPEFRNKQAARQRMLARYRALQRGQAQPLSGVVPSP